MGVPLSYTEQELINYLHGVLGDLAGVLGWTTESSAYAEAINSALYALQVDDLSAIQGREAVHKLRLIAAREVWRAAVDALSAHYDVSADGSTRERSQMLQHAQVSLALAEARALPYDPGYRVTVARVRYA